MNGFGKATVITKNHFLIFNRYLDLELHTIITLGSATTYTLKNPKMCKKALLPLEMLLRVL